MVVMVIGQHYRASSQAAFEKPLAMSHNAPVLVLGCTASPASVTFPLAATMLLPYPRRVRYSESSRRDQQGTISIGEPVRIAHSEVHFKRPTFSFTWTPHHHLTLSTAENRLA